MAKKLKITQVRSVIDRIEPQKRTIRALGPISSEKFSCQERSLLMVWRIQFLPCC